jgi:RNA polymerase sigma-70 factor (ECF subfamily)
MSAVKPEASKHAREAELLLRVAKGDRRAFADLFQCAAPLVKGYLLRLGCTTAAAEELAQEVMLTVWRKADRFDPAKAGAMTWLFVIARNRRIDSLRRERAIVIYGDNPPDVADDTIADAADQTHGAQCDDRIRAAMAELSSDQREVVQRSFFAEEPHAAIAAALNLPLGTVKSRLRLAMKKLRASLEDLR